MESIYDYDNSKSNDYKNDNNDNQSYDMEVSSISDFELERNITILQNAINLVKSQRKQIDKETELIYKRINYLKQKEKQIKIHCKKQIDQLHRTVEIKKKRLQDEILIEKKKNNINYKQEKDKDEF